MVNLFIYGSLLDTEMMDKVIVGRVSEKYDQLDGYVIVKHVLMPYPTVQAQTNGIVYGKVLNVSHTQLSRLDSYESTLYTKAQVMTRSGVECLVYIENRVVTSDLIEQNVQAVVDSLDTWEESLD
tara:strand:- start:50 stop:424 length:375 start_codon:yes stop_codon:yes gene_type:complete